MKKRYRLPPQNATRVRHLGAGVRLAAPPKGPGTAAGQLPCPVHHLVKLAVPLVGHPLGQRDGLRLPGPSPRATGKPLPGPPPLRGWGVRAVPVQSAARAASAL